MSGPVRKTERGPQKYGLAGIDSDRRQKRNDSAAGDPGQGIARLEHTRCRSRAGCAKENSASPIADENEIARLVHRGRGRYTELIR